MGKNPRLIVLEPKMTRLLIAVAAVAVLAVPASSFAAAAKKAAPKTEPKKEEPKKADPKAADPKAADPKAADPKAAPTADAGTAAPAADAGAKAESKAEATELQKISKLGLRFQGPIKMKQSEANGQVELSNDEIHVNVGPTTDFSVKTFEEAKLSKNDYNPTNVVKEDKLEDGWNIQFQNKGAMGDNYFVWVRRTFGKTSYQCEATVTTAEQAAKIEKICLSLAKQ